MKKITSLLLIFLIIFTLSAEGFASVLGSALIDGYTVPIGKGTTFTKRIYYSDQSGVGEQTEYFITYESNSDVTPIITHGEKLYGKKTISQETSRLSNMVNLTGGINADFFSLQTGVPMGNLISDGKIVSKDASGQDMIAIMKDGTAFMSYATFASVLTKADGTEVNIYNINKYRQPYSAYLLTDEFSDTTRATTSGYNIVLGNIQGEMRLGQKLTAVVESVTLDSGAVSIPAGKFVLTIDEKAPEEFLNPISSLAVGETVTLSFGALGEDTRWNDAELAMGSVGGRLIIDGEINPNIKNNGAAPRTAIGIKADGSLVLYTLDGRQSGHSYGAQLTTLAKRMKELGCVEALNLDGGGSTSIVSLFPGESGVPELRNKPSDGRERGVSTFFFLKNNLNPTGNLGGLAFYPFTAYVLTGADKQFSLKAYDTSFYPMDVPEGIDFSIATEGAQSEINSVGLFSAKDDGVVRIKAQSGEVSAVMDVVCLKTPTDIVLQNDEGKKLSSAYVNEGGIFQFTAVSYGGFNRLTADNSDYTWSVSPEIGTIDENGLFTAKRFINQSGTVSVSAGDKTVSIPVTVSYTPDEKNPDSYPKVTVEANKEAGTITANTATPLGIPISKDGIRVKADGKALDFEFKEDGKVSFAYPEGTNRVSIYATNAAGLSGFGYADIGAAGTLPVFADTDGHWAVKELNAMAHAGIISGEEYGGELIFRPQKQMNRSEFSVMIANYLGLDTNAYGSVNLPFKDADSIPSWALGATKALYETGIISGKSTPDGSLIGEPLSPITRAEAATIISRTLSGKFFIKDFGYPDMNTISDWAQNGMKTLMSLGAIGGYEDGTIKPQGYLSKAEAAKILYSIL